jgi:DNA polymerase elongation subunit (family B)
MKVTHVEFISEYDISDNYFPLLSLARDIEELAKRAETFEEYDNTFHILFCLENGTKLETDMTLRIKYTKNYDFSDIYFNGRSMTAIEVATSLRRKIYFN